MTKQLLIGAGALLMVLGGWAWMWSHEHRARLAAERSAEAAQLALKGQIVADQESKRALSQDIDSLLKENEDLKAAYQQARAAAPGAKPVGSAVLKTVPVRVEPRHESPPVVPTTPPDPGRLEEACALPYSGTVSFSVEELGLATSAGNYLIVGTAEAYRETPLPRERLARAKFSSPLSDTNLLESKPAPRWGALALGACSTARGCGPGVGILFPPLRLPLVGWTVDMQASALALPGAFQGQVGAGVRF